VKTDDGWTDIESILIGKNASVGRLQLKSGKTLVCTPMHVLIAEDGSEVYANESVGKNIKTADGIDEV